ncbi:MAG TPA: SRPBCC family protein [Gemmatimonadaceae bacterium]
MATITGTGTRERASGGAGNVDDLAVHPPGRSIPRGRQLESVGGGGRGNRGRLANALGWLGVGIGVAQIAAPGAVARLVGVDGSKRNRTLMRALGAREIAAGVGVLSTARPARWMWARTAGDAVDLSLLGATLTSDVAQKDKTVAATAAVLGVTALDVVSARRLTRHAGIARGENGERRTIVKKSITVNRTPEEVYAFWRDFENLPRFMRHLESVEVTGEGRSHWRATAPAGQTVEWDAEIIDDRPNELIAWRTVEGADVSHSGTVRFKEAPGGRGTEITVALQYDPPGGKVGMTLAKLFREEPGQQVNDDLRALKNVIETGEVVLSDATVRRGIHPAQPAEKNLTV